MNKQAFDRIATGLNEALEVARGNTVPPTPAELIKVWRLAKGMTQRDLADRALITHQQVGCVERGEHSPTIRTLERLARALGAELVIQFKHRDES